MRLSDDLIRHLLFTCDRTLAQELTCSDILPHFVHRLEGGLSTPADWPEDLRGHLGLCAACGEEWAALLSLAA